MTLKKIDHSFSHQPLSYDAQVNYQPYIRLSFFFSKLPEVSFEQFHRHWETVHADLTVASKAFKEVHIGRYIQFHQTPELKEKAKVLGLAQLEYDGCSDIYVKTWEEWMTFYQSPEYAEKMGRESPYPGASSAPSYQTWLIRDDLIADCAHFMAMPITVMVGYDNVIFGKALPDIGGKDGILPNHL